MALRAEWVPRLQNEEADALTNKEFHQFDLAKRVRVDLANMNFGVLTELLETGESYFKEVEALKAKVRSERQVASAAWGGKKTKVVPLRERDPW